ncbi:hypothetical protein N665_0285s0049 [Sinapis alba]|nr:hypothetical protein N665_0285s0049 [Sinapis alba]
MADVSSTVACGISKEIMLFGVRVVLDPMRKSVSLNNLSEYEHTEETLKIVGEDGTGQDKNRTTSGYASADDAVPVFSSGGSRERKRGVPWTEEEHKMFLFGLHKVGKGDWKGISKNFVKSRTSTQVASHAQKYFLRRSNLNRRRRRRRSSLFDMATPTVMEEDHMLMHENTSQPYGDNASSYRPFSFEARPIPISLNLSLASSTLNEPSSNSRHSAFNSIGVA